MAFISKNPATEEIFATFDDMTDEDVSRRLAIAQDTFLQWRETTFAFRADRMRRLAHLLTSESRVLGMIATREMGKPIRQAVAEVEKCALVCEYYAEHAEEMLATERIQTDASESFVRFDPLGIVLAVMPWNFPFWQVFRFAAPALMAGNVGILKHASTVPQCAIAIEELFGRAGFPEGVFQNFLLPSSRVEPLIRDPRVVAVALTGSEAAGRSVAAIAGSEIKKTVLELGGSDPFIILADADLEEACTVGVTARVQNAGQSCVAAKRFIVEQSIAEEFLRLFRKKFEALRVGDPMDEATDVGPMVSKNAREELEAQVQRSVEMGATIFFQELGIRNQESGYFYPPTILSRVKPGPPSPDGLRRVNMPAYDDELFGPVASVIVVADADEAIRVANDTGFGLGASIWTQNMEKAKVMAGKIETGAVFINAMVKSDPRLPFGGIKRSGYGRELGEYGIKEFVNVKTVVIS